MINTISAVIVGLCMISSLLAHAGRDHAPIYRSQEKPSKGDKILNKLGVDRQDYMQHVTAAEDFKDRYFRDKATKEITLEKTEIFLDKLTKEYYALKNRSYETKFLEQLDIAKTSAYKAQKEAIKPNVAKNILHPYEIYLIPCIKKMITAIKDGEHNDVVEGILDDFVRGYVPYFIPNPFNARYTNKVNLFGGVYHAAKHIERKKDSKKVQANNLQIKTEQQRNHINKYLEDDSIKIGDFLTHEQINRLLEQGFDISTLDPGESAFWDELTPQEKQQIYFNNPKYFPQKNTKVIFDRVLLGGANSPKVRVKYKNQFGKVAAAKLKVGHEVNSELAASALMRLLGFNADKMMYTDKVVMYLKDKNFENFEAEMRQKFGQYQNVRYNYERGVDAHGEPFIAWRDTLIEARPDEELRIGTLDIASWDLQNRREYRGSTLALAWLAINDLKTDNKKALLVKKNGSWIPQHRIHDTGIAFGTPFVLTGIDSVLSLPLIWAKVNQFTTSFVEKEDDGVHIAWNDFCYQYRYYGSSTYYDLKWMARKIAALSYQDIAEAFIKSGMPIEVAHLFTVKTIMRRNNIVRSFDLENEYDLYEEPKNIKKYSPPAYPNIKKGQINKTAYEGKNIIPIRIRTWGSLISQLISGQDIPFANFTKTFGDKEHGINGSLKGGAIHVDYQWNKEGQNIGPFGKLYLRPGLSLIPSRSVVESSQNINTTRIDKHKKPVIGKDGNYEKTHLPYMVIDTIKIVVALGLGAEQKSSLPVHGGLSINVLVKTITHRHFAETVKDAWLSPYQIPRIIREGKKQFASFNLRDLETVESYYSVGLSAAAQVGSNWANDFAENGLAVGASARKISSKLIYRDQFGRLHYVKEAIHKKDAHAKIDIMHGNLKLIDYAALSAQVMTEGLRGELVDYIIGQNDPLALQTHDHEIHNKEQAARELKAFRDLKRNPDHAEVMLNFSRRARAKNSVKGLNLFFVLSRSKNSKWGEVEDTLINGQSRQLFYASVYSGKHLGKKDVASFTQEATDIAVLHGKSKKTIVEVEKRAPEKFTIMVNSRVFARKTDHEGLLDMIKKLNVRYGNNPDSDEEHQFFADLVLPPKKDQDKYRKIYADMRTLIDGEYLLKKVAHIDEKDVTAMLDQFFSDEAITIRKARYDIDEDGVWTEKDSKPSSKVRAANQLLSARKQHKIIHELRALKKLLAKDADATDWPSIWIASRDLVHTLFSHYYGVHLVRAFLNINEPDELDKAILVYGEIRNIGDHISSLERPHGHHANMRSTGAHWGNYVFGRDKVRPIQYYLKFDDPTNQLPIYWSSGLKSSLILGTLEQGQPPNYTGEGI